MKTFGLIAAGPLIGASNYLIGVGTDPRRAVLKYPGQCCSVEVEGQDERTRHMNLTRKHALAGLAATGIAAATLAGGGVAVASTGPTPTPTMTATAPAHGYNCGHLRSGHSTVLTAAADYLGLSQDQLRSHLESGKSLADVAKAQGKPVSGLESAILVAVTSRVNAMTGLTAEQKAEVISEVKSHLGDIVTATCKPTASPSPMGTK
jgi:hypothetical protein